MTPVAEDHQQRQSRRDVGELTLSRASLRTVVTVGQLAASRPLCPDSAAEILHELRELVDFAAASFSLWDPFQRTHATLVNDGYTPAVLGHLETDYVRDNPAWSRIFHRRWPDRIDDCPFAFRDSPTFVEFLGASGYEEGMTTCLFAPDGRYTGMLNISVSETGGISEGARDLVGSLIGTFSQVVDVVRSPAWLAAVIGSGAHAVGVTRNGVLVPLPDIPPGPVLERAAALHALAAQHVLTLQPPRRMLWRDGELGWRSIQLLRAQVGQRGELDMAVLVDEPTELPHGLTPREIEVLTQLASGLTNKEIAARLIVSPKTVATHVEHLLDKLGQATRAGLAGVALERGLVLAPAPGSIRDA